MLIHCNKTISVSRLVEASWEKTRSTVISWYAVYLQPRAEKVVSSIDWQWAYKEYILMTDWINEIKIGDKINDWTDNYYVDWWQIFNDLTWLHWQYILMKDYE